MPSRVEQLIATLDLQPHPEGGWFREVFRSAHQVQPDDERSARDALTTIYFLLTKGQVSKWHRVRSDEVWHFYEGDPLELFWRENETATAIRVLLGPVSLSPTNAAASDGSDSKAVEYRPVHVIPAGHWQAARSTGAYTLVGCTVGPGFDFADFEMRDEPDPQFL